MMSGRMEDGRTQCGADTELVGSIRRRIEEA